MEDLKPQIMLVFNKSQSSFQDKSDEIDNLFHETHHVRVTYKRNGKEYRYNQGDVYQLSLKEKIDPAISDICINGESQNDIIEIGDYDRFYALVYKNKKTPIYLPRQDISLKRNPGKHIFSYLSEVSEYIKLPSDPNLKEEVPNDRTLGSIFNKVTYSDDTLLGQYLNGSPIITYPLPNTIIYPFDVNTSQKKAIKKALTHNISIIQGPPGTGKTQSILNLIANLICQNKSIGIVSNNNSAVENVKQKLEKVGYGFITAQLGKKDNKQKFFANLNSDFEPNDEWKQTPKVIAASAMKLEQTGQEIDRLLESQEELAQKREQLTNIKREQKSFEDSFGNISLPAGYDKLYKWDSHKLMAFKTALSHFPERLSLKLLRDFFNLIINYGKLFLNSRKTRGAELCLAIDSIIYDRKVTELEYETEKLKSYIEKSDLEQLNSEYSELSKLLFNHFLYERYSGLENPEFRANNYRTGSLFDAFVKRYPVIFSTTYSILSSVGKPLDYIIIDESSQVDIVTASLALSVCRNVVIVGDTQQLPHIVTEETTEQANELADQYNISHEYDYVKCNIIASLEKVYKDSVPRTLLREHYRCNPLIIGFCNQKYYKGQLLIMKDVPKLDYGAADYPVRIFRTAKGYHSHDMTNDRQIAVIERDVLPICNETTMDEIGIISPYRNQANRIDKRLCGNNAMESDTIHKFQGREKKKIIFSTVANQITPFMDDAKLINVAVSRAIDQFIMVMPHSYELNHGSNIGDLIRYIEHWNPDGAVDSKIVSYFDLLNPGGYSDELTKFKIKIQGKSKFESENIIETLLKEVLDENPKAYSGLDYKTGYPLYLMIKNMEGFSEREIDFCTNRLSHVDFVIINRCDNSFVMAIEVDGHAYHSVAKQQERDAIKNKALALNGIELLRLSTRGALEKEKITEKLQALTPKPTAQH